MIRGMEGTEFSAVSLTSSNVPQKAIRRPSKSVIMRTAAIVATTDEGWTINCIHTTLQRVNSPLRFFLRFIEERGSTR